MAVVSGKDRVQANNSSKLGRLGLDSGWTDWSAVFHVWCESVHRRSRRVLERPCNGVRGKDQAGGRERRSPPETVNTERAVVVDVFKTAPHTGGFSGNKRIFASSPLPPPPSTMLFFRNYRQFKIINPMFSSAFGHISSPHRLLIPTTGEKCTIMTNTEFQVFHRYQ